jgi:hypothetical protein
MSFGAMRICKKMIVAINGMKIQQKNWLIKYSALYTTIHQLLVFSARFYMADGPTSVFLKSYALF